jgi:DNA-directed RNA polymerase subunit RPC12/RpoP
VNPTTGKVTSKLYRCSRCGHQQHISTNHFGECYSWGRVNTCPKCSPWAKYPEFGGATTWECGEPLPEGMDKPAGWSGGPGQPL